MSGLSQTHLSELRLLQRELYERTGRIGAMMFCAFTTAYVGDMHVRTEDLRAV